MVGKHVPLSIAELIGISHWMANGRVVLKRTQKHSGPCSIAETRPRRAPGAPGAAGHTRESGQAPPAGSQPVAGNRPRWPGTTPSRCCRRRRRRCRIPGRRWSPSRARYRAELCLPGPPENAIDISINYVTLRKKTDAPGYNYYPTSSIQHLHEYTVIRNL